MYSILHSWVYRSLIIVSCFKKKKKSLIVQRKKKASISQLGFQNKVMAAAFVGGAALGAAFGEGFAVLHVTVKDVVSKARMFKPILKHLESTLDRLAPTVNEITQSIEQLDLPEVETKSLIEHMEEGEKLVPKCLKIRWWNYCFKLYYSPKLKKSWRKKSLGSVGLICKCIAQGMG